MTRSFATLLAVILLMTSSLPAGFATPASMQDGGNLHTLRTQALEFSGGARRVRVWMKGNTDMTGWVNQVARDSFGFTEEANLQDESLEFSQVEKIAEAGKNERLLRWKWNEMQKNTVVPSRVAITTSTGLRLEGVIRQITDGEMTVDVKKTSDKRLQPKGSTSLGRDSITSVRLKKSHIKGRVVGTIVGAGLGSLFAFSSMYAETSNGATDGQAAAIFGGTVGVSYLFGWLSDRGSRKDETLILVMPD